MSKQQARGGMGSHKHGVSGRTPKSPRVRMHMKLQAERAEQPKKPQPEMCESVQDLFRNNKK